MKPDPRANQRPIPFADYPPTPAGLRALADALSDAMPGPDPLGDKLRAFAGEWEATSCAGSCTSQPRPAE